MADTKTTIDLRRLATDERVAKMVRQLEGRGHRTRPVTWTTQFPASGSKTGTKN